MKYIFLLSLSLIFIPLNMQAARVGACADINCEGVPKDQAAIDREYREKAISDNQKIVNQIKTSEVVKTCQEPPIAPRDNNLTASSFEKYKGEFTVWRKCAQSVPKTETSKPIITKQDEKIQTLTTSTINTQALLERIQILESKITKLENMLNILGNSLGIKNLTSLVR